MSVIVMGMQIPRACGECRGHFLSGDGYVCCNLTNRIPKIVAKFNNSRIDLVARKESIDSVVRPDWCPLRPLPEKHGKLIDADAFKTMCREAVEDIRDEVFLPQDIEKVRALSEVIENLCLDLDEAPTIIEAED